MDENIDTDALARQARRLETACSIIQAAHSSLSLETMLGDLVQNLVEVGGFVGAELSLEGKVDEIVLRQFARTGTVVDDATLIQHTPIFVRGVEVGALVTYCPSTESVDELAEQLDFALPTVLMGIEHAVSFAELIQYRETLEDKVVERTAQLAEANQQLESTAKDLREAKAARDRFFANINHEIRTPLTLIQLATDGIARSDEKLSASSLQKLDEVNSSTRRLLHLVNSLLLLAAGDEGKLRVRPGPVDVALCLQRLTRNWISAAQKGAIDLVFEGPGECAATMDEAALETIIGNFISNAIKFTPAGGRITLTLQATDDVVTIRVRDTGPGIDPEFIPKLFGRFERSASAAASGVRGTGIGLSLSKELVDLQGGTIEVTRHDTPRGTSFEVVLPRHQAVTAVLPASGSQPMARIESFELPTAAAPKLEPLSEPEATILLAEDDPGLARHMTEVLSTRYRVLAARDGKAALAIAREHLPDLLVTDLEMPEMDGLELTREFLALQGTAMSPVLIVSAHAGLGERLAGFEAGAVDYVMKPFSADELLARIRSQLAIRKLAMKLHENQKLAAMGMLSAGLAHEIRNPANALVNALAPLIELVPDLQPGSNSSSRQLAEVALDAANQIRDRCRNILDYSRSEKLTRGFEDARLLVTRARRLLSMALANVEFREDIRTDEPLYCAGPLIEQILINLIDNAAFAAGPGGWVRVSVRTEGLLAVIEVGDSGRGVPVQLQERIFDPFFTTKAVGEGTGLGLTVSRRIAHNHGGDLRVVRQAEGSVFRLELPRKS